jgi:hypothetical protein
MELTCIIADATQNWGQSPILIPFYISLRTQHGNLKHKYVIASEAWQSHKII